MPPAIVIYLDNDCRLSRSGEHTGQVEEYPATHQGPLHAKTYTYMCRRCGVTLRVIAECFDPRPDFGTDRP